MQSKDGVEPLSTFAPFTTIPTQEYQALLNALESINSLRDELSIAHQKIAALNAKLEIYREDVELQRAYDRQRIAKLEHLPDSPEESPLLDELYKEMKAIGRKQVDFATAARMLGKSKSRVHQLKAAIGQDMRFILIPSESHSQKTLIRLRD